MPNDPAIDAVRAARIQISKEFGDDPARLIAHYIEFQKRYAERLLHGSDGEPRVCCPTSRRSGRRYAPQLNAYSLAEREQELEQESEAGVARYARCMRVTRDVAFFLHQQSEYCSLMDDLDYSFFTEKYWDALVEDDDLPLDIQRGCLALLFAMGMYEAGNVGSALPKDVGVCLSALRGFNATDQETERLKQLAVAALTMAATPQERRDWSGVESLLGQCTWVHEVAVRPYFEARSP